MPAAEGAPAVSIGQIVSAGVVWAEQHGQLSGALLAGERDLLTERASPEKLREFAAGRSCARGALEQLGVQTGPILRGDAGQPVWPPGAVGSITHCHGYCAAAAAPAGLLQTIGIDADRNEPLPPGVLASIAGERELRWLASAAPGSVHWDRLLFSMKESIFKAWYPLRGSLIEARDIEVIVDFRKAAFVATVFAPSRGRAHYGGLRSQLRIMGRYAAGGGLILTAAALPRR
jgi:4'-phosphopantetheinyl transferase EntD